MFQCVNDLPTQSISNLSDLSTQSYTKSKRFSYTILYILVNNLVPNLNDLGIHQNGLDIVIHDHLDLVVRSCSEKKKKKEEKKNNTLIKNK